jgi:hypothetical protein
MRTTCVMMPVKFFRLLVKSDVFELVYSVPDHLLGKERHS